MILTRCIKKVILRVVRLLRRRERPQPPHNCVPLSPSGDTGEKPLRCLLLDMPVDIILLILRHLPLVSQACLALTCKPLCTLLRFILDDERLAWPRFLASTPCQPECLFKGNESHIPRTRLLLKLEDGRWWYCSFCLKLHPEKRFPKSHIQFGPSMARFCAAGVGVVDLCACIALTVFDGVKLTEWLKTGAPNRDLHRNIRESFQYRILDDRPVLLHHCSVTSQMDAFVSLAMMAELDARDHLTVTTRYHVYWTEPHVLPPRSTYDCTCRPSLDTEPVALCPHHHAIAWLYDSFFGYYNWNDCHVCHTKFLLLGCAGDNLSCVIQGVRDLHVGRPWCTGCRYPWDVVESQTVSTRPYLKRRNGTYFIRV